MAPPIGTPEDRAALRAAVKDGLLMFATDHAPHSAAAKSGGFASAANGICGLEIAIAATWKAMVEEEGMDRDAWAEAWWRKPRAILSPLAQSAMELTPRTTHLETDAPWRFDPEASASLSRNSPYGGMEFSCRPAADVDGKERI